MKAQNEFGRNSNEFVRFMNERESQWKLDELFYEAWKLGYEPCAVAAYLYSEIQFQSVGFSMRMNSAHSLLPESDLKFDSFKTLNEIRNQAIKNENMSKL